MSITSPSVIILIGWWISCGLPGSLCENGKVALLDSTMANEKKISQLLKGSSERNLCFRLSNTEGCRRQSPITSLWQITATLHQIPLTGVKGITYKRKQFIWWAKRKGSSARMIPLVDLGFPVQQPLTTCSHLNSRELKYNNMKKAIPQVCWSHLCAQQPHGSRPLCRAAQTQDISVTAESSLGHWGPRTVSPARAWGGRLRQCVLGQALERQRLDMSYRILQGGSHFLFSSSLAWGSQVG